MDEFDVENYFYPKSSIGIKSTKTEDFKLLIEIFFPQTFFAISIIYSLILLIVSNYDVSLNVYGRSLNSVETYLILTLPVIVILLYQKFGLITFPSFANGVYQLLYQDYNLPERIEFFSVSIHGRIILLSTYILLGFYMAYNRFDNLADDGIIVYYIAYLSITINVLLEYFSNNGSGFLAIFLVIFITIFIFFMFQTISAFAIGFLIGLYIIRTQSGNYNSNFLYPSADGQEDTQIPNQFNY